MGLELKKLCRLQRICEGLKLEIRISKLETNSNDRNINGQNIIPKFQSAFVLNFEHSDFDIASDFVFRYSDFTSLFFLFENMIDC